MNRLKELRKEKKLYQKMVAKIFGVDVRTWRRWDGIEGSAVDKLNELTKNSKGKINVVGYQLIHGDNGYPITYILAEEDGE